MIDFNSNTDELEHRMEIEDARLEVVEEFGFQVRFPQLRLGGLRPR